MKLDTLYIVTYPGELSTLPDILTACDAEGLANQFKGGLDPLEIEGIYADGDEAKQRARELLKERDEEIREVGLIRTRIRNGLTK